jgi:hypothetical protein
MQARTWLQKLTDESSLWFNAVKAEDDGDYVTAASFYLKDTVYSGKAGSLVRQALSISCAANCIARIGAGTFAKQLYAESAKLYLKNSEKVIAESIREALWSLEEAYENLLLAGDVTAAKALRIQYLALAARKSPFASSSDAIRDFEERETNAKVVEPTVDSKALPQKLQKELQTALMFLQNETKQAEFRPATPVGPIDLDQGSRLDEKGIVS